MNPFWQPVRRRLGWVLLAALGVSQVQPARAQEKNVVADEARFRQLVPAGSKVVKLAGGFTFTEGPLWRPDGALLFSDVPRNRIMRLLPSGKAETYVEQSGFSSTDYSATSGFVGSNGLADDRRGGILVARQGDHAVARLNPDKTFTTLVDRYQGKPLNSPNDFAVRADGAFYFTDPPYFYPQFFDDPARPQAVSGIYLYRNGAVTQYPSGFRFPNGIGLSPDEKHLYVSSIHPEEGKVFRFDVQPDGSLTNRTFFFYAGADGLKIDQRGNLYLTTEKGVFIVSPEGRPIGILAVPEPPTNLNWGGPDHQTLYIAAKTGLYQIRLGVAGYPRPKS